MAIKKLSLKNFRCFQNTSYDLCDGLNFFHGTNGAGKTSILEAVYILGSGNFLTSAALDYRLSHLGEICSYIAALQSIDSLLEQAQDESIISLPIYPKLSDSSIDQIINSITELYDMYSK